MKTKKTEIPQETESVKTAAEAADAAAESAADGRKEGNGAEKSAKRARLRGMAVSVAVLAAIALVSGLLLGLLNRFTYVDPEADTLAKFAEYGGTDAEFEILERGVGAGGKIYYFARSKEEDPVYAMLAGGDGGFKGEVKIYVFVRGGVVANIVPGENGETYMDKLDAANFYDRFIGSPLVGAEIPTDRSELVSGATRSSTAVSAALRAARDFYAEYTKGGEENE